MATYQFPQQFGYSQQQSDGSYPSSSSDQQHQHQQQQQQQQSYQNQNQNQHQQAGNNFSGNNYYGFTDNTAQYQHQTQAYFGQSTNGVNQINLNESGHVNGHAYNVQFMNPNYDPFELGVPTGTGMYFNPSMQYIQPQLFFNQQQQQQQQQQPTTNYLHRPTHEQSNISPNGSIPGSAHSSHVNLQSITPERQPTRTPEDDSHGSHGSPLPTSLTGPTRSTQLARQKEGPVKAACLSCRQKKAKCDGVKPICTQLSYPVRSHPSQLTW
jgi:hypothetical protein